MRSEKKIVKDDPQIHLLAANYCEKIRGIHPETIDNDQVKVLRTCIQFFAHYIKYLPECNNDVLNLCRCFIKIIKNKSILFDVLSINRIIGIGTSMMIQRKEEDVIRRTCAVLKETLEIIPDSTLKSFVTKYARTLSYIFQKIYVVQTYFTQLRILEIFIFITKDLKNLLSDTISKHHLMKNATEQAVKLVLEKINKIDSKDFEKTSRSFLRFYNNSLFPKTCILSVEGRMTKMNGHSIKQKENMLINFNGRNLTISFFIPSSVFSSQETTTNELVFIEFECKSIESVRKEYKGRHYVDVSIEVDHAITYNEDMSRESLDEIKKISLRLIDEEATLKKFSESFYEKFKQNERMLNDHTLGIDNMSIMTFQTSASLLEDVKTMNETEAQQNHEIKAQNLIKDEIPKIEKLKTNQVVPREENEILMVKKETAAPKKQHEPVVSKQSQPKAKTPKRPKRQSAKKASELLSDIYDEDNMENDEKIKVSYRDFKAQQKKKNTALTKTANNNDSDDDNDDNYYMEEMTRSNRKSKTSKIKREAKPKRVNNAEKNHENKRRGRPSKNDVKVGQSKHYDTDDSIEIKLREELANKRENQEANKMEQQPKKVQRTVKEPVLRKPLVNFDLIKNITKEKVDLKSTIVKEQMRKFPENQVPRRTIMDDDVDMEIEPPIKVTHQSNINRKLAKKPSEESLDSGKTPKLHKEKPALKRPKEVEKQETVQPEKRRRLTVDNVFELCDTEKQSPPAIETTSKVEEWLKSTSDSFSLDMSDHIEPEIAVNQNVAEVAVPKVVQNEDADDESEVSYGQQFVNDEHQHYSSSSHESMDLDVKNVPKKKSITVAEKNPKLIQPSTNRQVDNASQNDYVMTQNNDSKKNLFMDPCKAFKYRSREAAAELSLRKKKIDEAGQNIIKKYDHSIAKYGKKCLEQVQKTKTQLKHVNQLYLRYESAKSKLTEELTEQEKMMLILKREVKEREEALELHNQNKKKELLNLKKEALQKNEELVKEAWREYIDHFRSGFNYSFQKAYEI